MQGLKVRWIWDDADMIELVCEVELGEFRGAGTCYVVAEDVARFADELDAFVRTLEGRVRFTTGLDDGTKAVCIELYTIDLARHTAAQVRIATEPARARGPVSRLEVELPVEPAALEQFARELRGLRAIGDEASLPARTPGG